MIDSKLHSGLRARFNPDGSMLRRHQLRMLEILKYVDRICRENDIPYWLSSGTCLGAIRHGGFIPWDDDLDIEMLHHDYLRLEKILLDEDVYDLQTYRTDAFYTAPYAKLRDRHSVIAEHSQDNNYCYRGIYIDIFQLEPLSGPVGYLTGGVNWKLLKFGSRTSRWTYPFFIISKQLFFASVPVLRFLSRHLCNSNVLRHTFGSGFEKNIRRREWLLPTRRIRFEDSYFPVPHDTDSYLRSMFGASYMSLPDLENLFRHITKIEIH